MAYKPKNIDLDIKTFAVALALLMLPSCKNEQKSQEKPSTELLQLPAFKTLSFTQRNLKATTRAYVETFPTPCKDQAVYSLQNADQAYAEVQALIDAQKWQAVNLQRGKSWVVWLAGELNGDVMRYKLLGEWWTNPDRTGVLSLCLFDKKSDGTVPAVKIPAENLQ